MSEEEISRFQSDFRVIADFFRQKRIVNDYIPINQTQGSSTSATTIFAGCWDDGSRKVGITGLTPMVNSGIFVSDVGEAEAKNELITRVRFYCGLAVFSDLALAAASGITN